jgi:hypothetical protein
MRQINNEHALALLDARLDRYSKHDGYINDDSYDSDRFRRVPQSPPSNHSINGQDYALDRLAGSYIPDAKDSYTSDPPLSVSTTTTETSIDDQSFLSLYDKTGTATLTILDPYTQTTTVLKNIDLEIIQLVSPVLAFSFEQSRQGEKYTIEDTSLTAVLCMLRYIYAPGDHYMAETYTHHQLSTLLHVELYNLAITYDIATLKALVKARLFLQLELSTSYPGPPKDICKALSYAYRHMPKEAEMTKTLAHYCISCFLQHRLHEDELFAAFHYECRPFQHDLCVILRENWFRDDAAPTLIQLPIKSSDVPRRWPVIFDADPLGHAGNNDNSLDDELENRVKRNTMISRLDKLRIHFHITDIDLNS